VFQITVSKEYLELEPIGMLFIVFFGFILIIQFLAMLVHRFGTLSHMLSTTQMNWFRSGPQVRCTTSPFISIRLKGGHYSRIPKVASSIPDEVIFFLNLPNPSGRTRPWGLLSL
jgi:hypothetical protein